VSKNPVEWAQASREFVNEVQMEFKKVTWPTQKEATAGTASVLIVVVAIGLVLFLVDSVLAWLMNAVLP
jgi:preprotein translocase subunit SecE